MTMIEDGTFSARASPWRQRSAARWPARRAIRRKQHHGDHPVCRRQRQRRGQPHHARQDVEEHGPADHRREPARRRRQFRHRRRRRKAAPDGYTLVGGGSGPVAANVALYKVARLRPREGPGDDLAVRRLHHRRGGQQEHAGPVAQGAGRLRQGQSRQAELRLGRHRQLAASGRRVFRPDHRREDDARALPQHRAVRARPDRGHGAARLPVVSERRRPDQAPRARFRSRSRATSASPALPDTPTTTEPACRNTRSDGWFALLAPAGTPKPILERLNKEMKAAVEDPAGEEGLRNRRRRADVDAARTRSRSGIMTRSPNTATSSPRPASRRSNRA